MEASFFLVATKPGQTLADPCQNRYRTLRNHSKNYCRTIAKSWQNHGKPLQNHCKTMTKRFTCNVIFSAAISAFFASVRVEYTCRTSTSSSCVTHGKSQTMKQVVEIFSAYEKSPCKRSSSLQPSRKSNEHWVEPRQFSASLPAGNFIIG